VFVFPSRTDSFGIVLLEAMASGVPVAAYPTTGPIDVIGSSGAGVLDEDLGRAVLGALDISPDVCRARAMTFSWQSSAQTFFAHVEAGNAGRSIDVSPLARHGLMARARRYWAPRTAAEPTA
jgi:glycosyltransferase involved in cell wall biosynthesis